MLKEILKGLLAFKIKITNSVFIAYEEVKYKATRVQWVGGGYIELDCHTLWVVHEIAYYVEIDQNL